jgi:hypothetical protein
MMKGNIGSVLWIKYLKKLRDSFKRYKKCSVFSHASLLNDEIKHFGNMLLKKFRKMLTDFFHVCNKDGSLDQIPSCFFLVK